MVVRRKIGIVPDLFPAGHRSNQAHLHEQGEGIVDCRSAAHGEIPGYRLVNCASGGMICARGEKSQDGTSLGRERVTGRDQGGFELSKVGVVFLESML